MICEKYLIKTFLWSGKNEKKSENTRNRWFYWNFWIECNFNFFGSLAARTYDKLIEIECYLQEKTGHKLSDPFSIQMEIFLKFQPWNILLDMSKHVGLENFHSPICNHYKVS